MKMQHALGFLKEKDILTLTNADGKRRGIDTASVASLLQPPAHFVFFLFVLALAVALPVPVAEAGGLDSAASSSKSSVTMAAPLVRESAGGDGGEMVFSLIAAEMGRRDFTHEKQAVSD
jgi:hypothetical protein